VSNERTDAFRHYLVAMTKFFEGAARLMPSGSPVVMVVGHSAWNHAEIPTTDLFREVSEDNFEATHGRDLISRRVTG
jgi:hypothetical protein